MLKVERIMCLKHLAYLTFLYYAPIASISSVTIDGVATTDYTMEGLDNETIDLDGYADKVKVTYITTGLSDDLLKQAILTN